MRARGLRVIAGVDEAGRGPLAGPVVAAAVILPAGYHHPSLDDSKKLSVARRAALYDEELTAVPSLQWSCALAEPWEIDRLNILKATHAAMARAVMVWTPRRRWPWSTGCGPGFPLPARSPRGRGRQSPSVAAASVIAKVERDRMMIALARTYPEYGFDRHKGYGTKMHLEKLRIHGPCPIHRRSFAPVARMLLDFEI